MAESARIGLTFARVGLGPDMGASYFLPRLVGLAKANELAFTGELLTAAEAERIGLVSKVVDDGKVVETALDVAARLADGPPAAIRWTKQALNNWLRLAGPTFDASLALEFLGFSGPELREGLASLKEKRKPQFGTDQPF